MPDWSSRSSSKAMAVARPEQARRPAGRGRGQAVLLDQDGRSDRPSSTRDLAHLVVERARTRRPSAAGAPRSPAGSRGGRWRGSPPTSPDRRRRRSARARGGRARSRRRAASSRWRSSSTASRRGRRRGAPARSSTTAAVGTSNAPRTLRVLLGAVVHRLLGLGVAHLAPRHPRRAARAAVASRRARSATSSGWRSEGTNVTQVGNGSGCQRCRIRSAAASTSWSSNGRRPACPAARGCPTRRRPTAPAPDRAAAGGRPRSAAVGQLPAATR